MAEPPAELHEREEHRGRQSRGEPEDADRDDEVGVAASEQEGAEGTQRQESEENEPYGQEDESLGAPGLRHARDCARYEDPERAQRQNTRQQDDLKHDQGLDVPRPAKRRKRRQREHRSPDRKGRAAGEADDAVHPDEKARGGEAVQGEEGSHDGEGRSDDHGSPIAAPRSDDRQGDRSEGSSQGREPDSAEVHLGREHGVVVRERIDGQRRDERDSSAHYQGREDVQGGAAPHTSLRSDRYRLFPSLRRGSRADRYEPAGRTNS